MAGSIQRKQGANLPHWTAEGGRYFITFRLADSLPASAIEKLRAEQQMIERQFDRATTPLSAEQMIRRSKLKSEAWHKMLDQSYGECVLAKPEVAEIVSAALKFFDKQRYLLYAWCVMPNHVHTVVQPTASLNFRRFSIAGSHSLPARPTKP